MIFPGRLLMIAYLIILQHLKMTKISGENRFASAHLPEIDVGIVEPGQGTKRQLWAIDVNAFGRAKWKQHK